MKDPQKIQLPKPQKKSLNKLNKDEYIRLAKKVKEIFDEERQSYLEKLQKDDELRFNHYIPRAMLLS